MLNESYAQYRDPSGKKKKKHKRHKKPLFKRGNRTLKPGDNPFAGKPQKKRKTDFNDSPFATKKKQKNHNKRKKRKKHQGEGEQKSRYSNKRPKKKLGKKEKARY